ncbi:ComEC/Rec2 family competence protein [Polaribacter pectinis]|uniref:ComEC/Rec2 family competence protein n=1 Tax=Polaribacter pectinis TaxID=2738844 RepID=A0A7G9LAJ7_9FLAO|nr:ComEC/Rec2 family competence protein [Polaribacter pectinis]QNM85646.1 ComEC/Rec2 family competence protein [Polaribacter pectinis]
MKRLIYYLPMHFVVLGVIGIITQFYTQIWNFGVANIAIFFLSLLVLLFLVRNKIITTILTFISFFLIGIATVYVNDGRNHKDYYQNHLKENSTTVFTVKKVLKHGVYHNKYQVEVAQVDSIKTRGEILLNIQKDSLFIPLKVDDKLLLKPTFLAIKPASNPHQFNYKTYLEKQGIYQQVYIEKEQFLKLESKDFSLVGLSSSFRNYIQKSLEKHTFKKDELNVINALLLGQRQDISKDLIEDYQRAGAIHVLAVSGLHVGVILLLLTFILKPLEKLKYGRFLKTFCIVLLLWMFAFIAGLSASVVRAVTMFTFLAVGQTFQRKNVITFSLITSMFFLLIVKPMFLFDVGFQLSYLAVFGIIWVQPKLADIWKPKFKITNFFWQLLTVSVAAQLGVLPLSIFYFQQFPGLFLLSNFVIIPCLMYVLIGGILVIFLSLINFLPDFIVTIYGTVISWMNTFVSWISKQEDFLFKEISISFFMMIIWYLLIVFGVRFFLDMRPNKLLYFLTSILVLQTIYFIEVKNKESRNELVVFHKTRHAVIGKRVGEQLYLQHDLDSVNFDNDYSLKSYRIAEDIKEIQQTNFKNLINFYDDNILVIDSLGVYKIKGLQKPIVVLQYSPKINLERLIKTINPSQIIADGSNYRSYVEHWKKICQTENVPFYDTNKHGAFILKR